MRQVVEARSLHRCATVDNEKHVHSENTCTSILYCVLGVATVAVLPGQPAVPAPRFLYTAAAR